MSQKPLIFLTVPTPTDKYALCFRRSAEADYMVLSFEDGEKAAHWASVKGDGHYLININDAREANTTTGGK